MMRRARLIGMSVLTITFGVGALTGAATLQVLNAGEAPLVKRSCVRQETDLLDRLELAPAQREQVEAVLEGRRLQMEEFWQEHGPVLRGIADSARAEMRALLTPEQREIEERFIEERRAQKDRDQAKRGRKW